MAGNFFNPSSWPRLACLCIFICSKMSPKDFDALHLASGGVILRPFFLSFLSFLSFFLCFIMAQSIFYNLDLDFPYGKYDIILWILYLCSSSNIHSNTATLTATQPLSSTSPITTYAVKGCTRCIMWEREPYLNVGSDFHMCRIQSRSRFRCRSKILAAALVKNKKKYYNNSTKSTESPKYQKYLIFIAKKQASPCLFRGIFLRPLFQ
jgi:hypothetical protein